MRSSATRMSAFGFIAATVLVLASGCVQLGDGVLGGNDNGSGSGDGNDNGSGIGGLVADDEVLVVFRNLATSDAVDVEFHATNQPLESLPDDLIVDDFLLKTGIGLAGTGILAPIGVDAVTIPCTDTTTIGTAGGAFLDNSTGDETGRGIARWAETAGLGLCGSIVTFTFDERSDGFTTNVAITR